MCTVHNLPITLICQNDSKLFCQDCAKGVKQEEKKMILSISEFTNNVKVELESKLKILDSLLIYSSGPSNIVHFQSKLKERVNEFFKHLRQFLQEMQKIKLKEIESIFADIFANGNTKNINSSVAGLEELKIMKIVGDKHLENLSKSLSNNNFHQAV